MTDRQYPLTSRAHVPNSLSGSPKAEDSGLNRSFDNVDLKESNHRESNKAPSDPNQIQEVSA